MSASPLYIVLCSAEHEKIQMAAMLASVAAVSDRAVHLLISMNALLVFRKNLALEQRYRGGEFSQMLLEKNAPDAVTLFQQGRMLGEMTVLACTMAIDVSGLELDDLVDDLFDGAEGLTAFLAAAESGELLFI